MAAAWLVAQSIIAIWAAVRLWVMLRATPAVPDRVAGTIVS
jgi:hypothetical protein